MLRALETAGAQGVEMECSDGWVRRCYPVLGAYIADHPEQCMIACCRQNTCWGCKVLPDKRGENEASEAKTQREVGAEIIAQALGVNSTSFFENGYKAVGCAPFWSSFPYCDIFSALTPDLLHQAHKGLFQDHIFSWCQSLVDDDHLIDDRFSVLPQHSSLVPFEYGVTALLQTTGRQHKSLEKSIAAVVSGQVPHEALRTVQAAMSFMIMIAGLTTHTTSTLLWLQDALDQFHALKWIFVKHGVRDHFNFPKIHSLQHYVESIRLRGSLDGYNSEISERLHIDMTKQGYRASNKRGYTKQMTSWRYRLDAVLLRDVYIQWAQDSHSVFPHFSLDDLDPQGPGQSNLSIFKKIAFRNTCGTTVYLPKHPSFAPIPLATAPKRLNMPGLKLFSASHAFLQANRPDLAALFSEHIKISVFVKADLSIDPEIDPYAHNVHDCLHASPPTSHGIDGEDESTTGRFDTVLVRKHPGEKLEFGMESKYDIASTSTCAHTFGQS